MAEMRQTPDDEESLVDFDSVGTDDDMEDELVVYLEPTVAAVASSPPVPTETSSEPIINMEAVVPDIDVLTCAPRQSRRDGGRYSKPEKSEGADGLPNRPVGADPPIPPRCPPALDLLGDLMPVASSS
jgi:hypothetical protein